MVSAVTSDMAKPRAGAAEKARLESDCASRGQENELAHALSPLESHMEKSIVYYRPWRKSPRHVECCAVLGPESQGATAFPLWIF
jgi:hypothetical protein